MKILIAQGWENYELLDSGDGKRLERFGEYILARPDPQAIWKPHLTIKDWQKANATFVKSSGEKGNWSRQKNVPNQWRMSYNNVTFYIRLSPFKHTGIFPEQAAQWEFIRQNLSLTFLPIQAGFYLQESLADGLKQCKLNPFGKDLVFVTNCNAFIIAKLIEKYLTFQYISAYEDEYWFCYWWVYFKYWKRLPFLCIL